MNHRRAFPEMRKLILRNGYSPGDVVMLTAAVRDLHLTYPGRFLTDVRTSCPDLWLHNPHVTPLSEEDPAVEVLDCSYPLIDRSNVAPYHCLHGFAEFLSARLGLRIQPTLFKGDIHLSAQEKAWYSQVREFTRRDLPFWIIDAGGKYDVTVKWWKTERYQAVVDHFRGRIQFVQVGANGHHHPKLAGVIDLRGRTTLRELIRLVYHAQGVLCPVTALMHLAAAIEVKGARGALRPCVVVAGGREPPHWEAYPGHQFLHTIGALRCCAHGGCWKDRTLRLGDGDPRDRRACRCVDVVDGLPHCLDLIQVADVVGAIERYFEGGSQRWLSAPEHRAAERGVRRSAANPFDRQPLSRHSAGLACARFCAELPEPPEGFQGRGVVIAAGGVRQFTNAWVCIRRLRRLGCRLPIQAWHLGEHEMDRPMQRLLEGLGVECVDASKLRRRRPARRLGGWELKAYALVHSPFAEVLLLDADNFPLVDPEALFDAPEFRRTGAVFWPDYGREDRARVIWRSCGVRRPHEPEFESGQVLVDKRKCWPALCLALWFNEHSDFYYRHLHGDKETFHLAFRRLRQPYALVPHPIRTLPGTMCQHDFQGRRIFQHRNTDKWNLFLHNRRVPGFWCEDECRGYVEDLRRVWDGRIGPRPWRMPRTVRRRTEPRLLACMISCPERERTRQATLARLAATDWGAEPVVVEDSQAELRSDPRQRQTATAKLALARSLDQPFDYLLFLEDDLAFNPHLRHNVLHWEPLRRGWVTLAGLYNPGLRVKAIHLKFNATEVEPRSVYGSQAFLLARATVEHLCRYWHRGSGMQDLRMSRLAGRLGKPLLYHSPSLVQHVGRRSVWGGPFHQAPDFDPDWRG